MHALASKRLSRKMTLFLSVLLLAGCGKGDGPTPIYNEPAEPLPDLPPGYCDPINFEILCEPATIVNFNGGATTVIDNPDASGINESDKVAQMQKFPDEVFGGTKFELAEGIDFAAGESYKIKVWSPRSVAVLFKLEETGNPNGGFAQEVSHSGSSSWEELCFDFTGQTVPPPVQALTIIFDNGTMGAADTDPANWTFFYDDIEQVDGCEGTVPKVPATLPVDFENDPKSYDFGTEAGFGGGFANVKDNPDASGINTSPQTGHMKKGPPEVYGGATLVLAPVSLIADSSFTMKVWSERQVNVLLKLETFDPIQEVEVMHGGTGWEELTFAYPGVSGEVSGLSLIFDNGTVGAVDTDPDNWTFYFDDITLVPPSGPATEPTVAAPTPTEDSANVISLFSDAYTNISPIDYNPSWNQGTVVTEVSIAGNNTLKYAGLDYQGTDFENNAQDVSGMDTLHLDFWTADSTALSVYLISSGPVETEHVLTVTPNTWVSVDVPLTVFTGVDLTNAIQLKIVGNGTVFLDNLYFATSGGGPADPGIIPDDVIYATDPGETVDLVATVSPFGTSSMFNGTYALDADFNPAFETLSGTGYGIPHIAQLGFIDLPAGFATDYETFSFKIKSADLPGNKVTVKLEGGGGAYGDVVLTDTTVSTPLGNGWYQVVLPMSGFTNVAPAVGVLFEAQDQTTGFSFLLTDIGFSGTGGPGGGGTSCPPVGSELATNGDFEAGDLSCWEGIVNNGTITADNAENNTVGGAWSAHVVAGAGGNPTIKQNFLAEGTVMIGDTIDISFDMKGTAGAGGVIFPKLISEGATGSDGPILETIAAPTAGWTTYTYSPTITADVARGITFEIAVVCGTDPGCIADVFIDNVTVQIR